MPIHDWSRVDAGVFHHFHVEWMSALARAFNRGLLPHHHYALVEQTTDRGDPDVHVLREPGGELPPEQEPAAGVALEQFPPQVRWRARTHVEQYAAKARAVIVRHASDHRVIAVLDVVSPGNKSSRWQFEALVSKAEKLLLAGVHLLIVDLFPPGSQDAQGAHGAIWERFTKSDFLLPTERRLTLASYIGGPLPKAFIEPTVVGATLHDMPLFLSPEVYVSTPLEATYLSAWKTVPPIWRKALTSQS